MSKISQLTTSSMEQAVVVENIATQQDPTDIHNKFTHIMPGLVVLRKRIDMGWDGYQSDIDAKNEQFADEHAKELYTTIRDAAVTPVPEDWEHVYGDNPKKVGPLFADLSRSYKLASRKGFLSSYETRYFDRSKRRSLVPTDARRIPTSVTERDISVLSAATDEEKIPVIAEMLDHARYRQDVDADPELKEAQAKEQSVLVELLATLPVDYRRDLLAADATSHFLHRRINRPDLAAKSLELISVPELKDALAQTVLRLEDSSPERLVTAARQRSRVELERITEETGLYTGQIDRLVEQSKELEDRASVVINMKTGNMVNFLFETFRMLPAYEAGSSGVRHMHRWDRVHDEEVLGLHGENDFLNERPIYGALVAGDREKALGPDPAAYGSCVVEIKPEVARSRTTYTYGDSLNSRRLSSRENEARPVDFGGALAAKVIFDQKHPDPSLKDSLRTPYVEAQILGGVGVEDIAAVTFPFDDVVSYGGHQAPYQVLRAVRQEYPSIKCKVLIDKVRYAELSDKAKATYTDAGIELMTPDGSEDSFQ